MRVLVTGSRDWPSRFAVYTALEEIALQLIPGEVLTVVHGDCPRGADWFARSWCEHRADRYPIVHEPHPADWKTHGKKAGFLRNAEMVKLGADVCLAFIKGNSRGASMTKDLAEKAGITTIAERMD